MSGFNNVIGLDLLFYDWRSFSFMAIYRKMLIVVTVRLNNAKIDTHNVVMYFFRGSGYSKLDSIIHYLCT